MGIYGILDCNDNMPAGWRSYCPATWQKKGLVLWRTLRSVRASSGGVHPVVGRIPGWFWAGRIRSFKYRADSFFCSRETEDYASKSGDRGYYTLWLFWASYGA